MIPKATHWSDRLVLFAAEVECGVLDDGRRVLPEESILSALQAPRGETLERLMAQGLGDTSAPVVDFLDMAGRQRRGLEAARFMRLCTGLADRADVLPKSWRLVAEVALRIKAQAVAKGLEVVPAREIEAALRRLQRPAD